jgi:CofD-related protein of GAK system
MVDGDDPLVADISDPMRNIIRTHLRIFADAMPDSFDLRGASIGNLILAGGYLNNGRHIDPVVFMFAKLVEAHGTVRTIVSGNFHLVAELADGTIVHGQRNLTGKETSAISSPVEKLYLVDDLQSLAPANISIRNKIQELITNAELICYPMGSFYSSLVANLLPGGVVEAISQNQCPKVYVPNTGSDPEQFGMTVTDCVATLRDYLTRGTQVIQRTDDVLQFVVLDSRNGEYPGGIEVTQLDKLGIVTIDTRLVTEASAPYIDPKALISVLLSLV